MNGQRRSFKRVFCLARLDARSTAVLSGFVGERHEMLPCLGRHETECLQQHLFLQGFRIDVEQDCGRLLDTSRRRLTRLAFASNKPADGNACRSCEDFQSLHVRLCAIGMLPLRHRTRRYAKTLRNCSLRKPGPTPSQPDSLSQCRFQMFSNTCEIHSSLTNCVAVLDAEMNSGGAMDAQCPLANMTSVQSHRYGKSPPWNVRIL